MTSGSHRVVLLLVLLLFLPSGCAELMGPSPSEPSGEPSRGTTPASRPLDARQTERLGRIMVPLLAAMDHPLRPDQARLAVIDDPHVNAASAGGGDFYVTTGLLDKANDNRLRGVLAHELAHDDLGHVARAQALGAGLAIGVIVLDEILPGSGRITPIAGTLIASGYSRREEYEADRHGVDLLRRAGYSKESMIDTLTWLMETEGDGGGGFFATHPGTQERIDALAKR